MQFEESKIREYGEGDDIQVEQLIGQLKPQDRQKLADLLNAGGAMPISEKGIQIRNQLNNILQDGVGVTAEELQQAQAAVNKLTAQQKAALAGQNVSSGSNFYEKIRLEKGALLDAQKGQVNRYTTVGLQPPAIGSVKIRKAVKQIDLFGSAAYRFGIAKSSQFPSLEWTLPDNTNFLFTAAVKDFDMRVDKFGRLRYGPKIIAFAKTLKDAKKKRVFFGDKFGTNPSIVSKRGLNIFAKASNINPANFPEVEFFINVEKAKKNFSRAYFKQADPKGFLGKREYSQLMRSLGGTFQKIKGLVRRLELPLDSSGAAIKQAAVASYEGAVRKITDSATKRGADWINKLNYIL